MALQPPSPPRKQRTRQHVLADLSANHVERFALNCGFAVNRLWHDYGMDLAVFTFDERGFLESGVIWMQLKATDHLKKTHTGDAVLVRLDRRDVLVWIAELYPVILVVYNAAQDRAYWLEMQTYATGTQAFVGLHGQTVTIRIPAANSMSAEAMREIGQRKAALLGAQGERS